MLSLQGLHCRAAFLRCVRSFFLKQGFLEVDTPLRQPVCIPESNISLLTSEGQYLQASPELCMKRLLAQGCDKIFQVAHCFRKGERGRLHQEEFLLLEWYRTGCDYRQLMQDCYDLLLYLKAKLQCEQSCHTYLGENSRLFGICCDQPWQHFTVAEAFARYSPISLDEAMEKDLFEELLTEFVEPNLGVNTPTFLYDYPMEFASLAKKSSLNSEVAERFELYIAGVELANGFTELTDEEEQRDRFKKEIDLIFQRQNKKMELPERFLQDLSRLPQTAGIALGLDRLFMLLIDAKDISAAVTFAVEDLC